MRIVIAGATGLIGQQLVSFWLLKGYDITVISRSHDYVKKIFGDKVKTVEWKALRLDDLREAQLVVNLAGANVGDKRWTEARKNEILESRVKATSHLANLLKDLGEAAPVLFNASAIGIYGLQPQQDLLPPALTEETDIDMSAAPDFLAKVGRAWEQAAEPAIRAGVRVVFLRFAVVLAEQGGALPEIVRPFRFFVGGPIGTGCQPFSWVVIDDVVRAIDFLTTLPDASGPYNIVAPECVMQKTLATTIGKVLHRPAIMKMPGFALKLMLGAELAQELLLQGQHVYPARLQEAGFSFQYPELHAALTYLLE